jgi:glycosyltransferase involved in cell wall biosynthesis
MRTPLVSILIPAFNAEQWIADALRSAVGQTWPEKEIIIVDDGSTDKTAAIAKQFASMGVRVVTQNNSGAAAARNRAFSESRGEYIQWLDADDLLASSKIAEQMKDVAAENLGARTLLSSSFGRFTYRHYRTQFTPTALWSDLSPTEWLLRKMGQNLYMQTSTWLVSRELTEAAGPWNTSLWEDDDGEYFARMMLYCDRVRFVSRARVYYRVAGTGSVSHIGLSNKKREAHWLSMRLNISYLRTLEDSSRVRAACVRYLENSMVYFWADRRDIVLQAKELARELGGELSGPRLSWKYFGIRALLGNAAAYRAQLVLPNLRSSAVRSIDRALFFLEQGSRVNLPQ